MWEDRERKMVAVARSAELFACLFFWVGSFVCVWTGYVDRLYGRLVFMGDSSCRIACRVLPENSIQRMPLRGVNA